MKEFAYQNYDEERAFYGERDIFVHDCRFAGPADGESAFKECAEVQVAKCQFDLRYPFWHVNGLKIENCQLSDTCRAALWYSDNIRISSSKTAVCTASRLCASATGQ